MDVERTGVTRRRWIRRTLYALLAVAVLTGTTVGLSRLKPAEPAAERSSLIIDSVKRGLMLRQVRGPGKLVPEEILWIPTPTDARVQNVPWQPGVAVKPDTVLVELSNPELVLATTNAEWGAKSAEAELISQEAKLNNQTLEMEATIAKEEADHHEAELQLEVDQRLFKDDLIAERNLNLSKARVANLAKLISIDQKRIKSHRDSLKAQLAVQEAKVEQAKAEYELKKRQLDSLKVRAGLEGVLEQVKVEVGQRVIAGTVLAKVTNPHKLKAVLKIPETQARDITQGQKAMVDTRNTVVAGRVVRIDPAAESGTVTVDVTLDGAMPREARPDLSVDGTIELERLEDVLYLTRPSYSQPDSAGSLFRVNGDGSAVRTPVKFGRGSVMTIEVVSGLSVDDQVIVSDTREWDAYQRIRVR